MKIINKRKKILIYPKFQIKLIILNLLLVAFIIGSVVFFINQSFTNLHEQGISANLSASHPYFGFLKYQSSLLYKYLWIGTIVGFVITTWLSLILSFKLAGPIVRLHSYFGEMAKGNDLDKNVSFREGDFFNDLPDLINKAHMVIKENAKAKENKDE